MNYFLCDLSAYSKFLLNSECFSLDQAASSDLLEILEWASIKGYPTEPLSAEVLQQRLEQRRRQSGHFFGPMLMPWPSCLLPNPQCPDHFSFLGSYRSYQCLNTPFSQYNPNGAVEQPFNHCSNITGLVSSSVICSPPVAVCRSSENMNPWNSITLC